MRRLALIAAGGAVGALARAGVVVAAGDRVAVAVLLVNVTGAFALGVLHARLAAAPERDALLRPLLGVGALGAFTTFSSFALLLTQLPVPAAVAYAIVMVTAGLAAARFGVGLGAS